MTEVLGTGRLPENLAGDLSDQSRLTGSNGASLLNDLRKEGVPHAFLGRLTAEEVPVPGIMEFTILGVYLDGGAQILHLLFSITVGNYNTD